MPDDSLFDDDGSAIVSTAHTAPATGNPVTSALDGLLGIFSTVVNGIVYVDQGIARVNAANDATNAANSAPATTRPTPTTGTSNNTLIIAGVALLAVLLIVRRRQS